MIQGRDGQRRAAALAEPPTATRRASISFRG